MQLIDSHCHLNFSVFDPDRDQILKSCVELGIEKIIVPATIAKEWQQLFAICQQYPSLYPAIGLHPMFMNEHADSDLVQLSAFIEQTRPIAVGEIGLDFYLPEHDKTQQIALFEAQLKIAKQFALPVILHVRKAHDQVLSLLRKHQITQGIVHAFSGSQQQAELYIKQGFLLGVGGVISYEKATKVRKLFSQLPLTAIALETDAPDMPLAGMQGQRNSPESITAIVQTLAELRTESIKQIADVTTQNVNNLLFKEATA
jgi:TatD DNase family protein